MAEKTLPPVSEVTIEENDWTGDSGMGTGSGSTRYGTRDEWREALKNPPPGVYIVNNSMGTIHKFIQTHCLLHRTTRAFIHVNQRRHKR